MAKGNKNMGWIKLHRKIWMSEIWQSPEPFDERSAWIDLIMMANHEPHTINTKDGPVTIERGQLHTSIRKLSQRWKWSEGKVRRFIRRTIRQCSVRTIRQGNGTTITIENYTFYQDGRRTDGATNRRTDGTTDGTRTRNKKKEAAGGRKNDPPRPAPDEELGPPIFK